MTSSGSYFAQVSTEKLALYVDQRLNSHFAKSGFVLQDLVNELGRRIEYKVTNGRYQGVVGAIGFDGISRFLRKGIRSWWRSRQPMPIELLSIRSKNIDRDS